MTVEMPEEYARSTTVGASDCPALVLNADFRPLSYFPLSLWSWQDAIKASFLDRVRIIATYDRWVRSPSTEMQLPSVVVLKSYVSPVRTAAFTRFNLFLRDGFVCQYCGSGGRMTFDHVVPRSQGRADDMGQRGRGLHRMQSEEGFTVSEGGSDASRQETCAPDSRGNCSMSGEGFLRITCTGPGSTSSTGTSSSRISASPSLDWWQCGSGRDEWSFRPCSRPFALNALAHGSAGRWRH